MKRLRFFAMLFIVIGCNTDRDPESLFGPEEIGVLVVDSFLIVDKPLPDFFVRETIGLGALYMRNRTGVLNAEVVIRQGDRIFVYWADPDSVGRYLPPDNAPLVLPETKYSVTVRSQGRKAIATTITPPRLVLEESVWISEESNAIKRRLKTFKEEGSLVFLAPENQVVYQDGLIEARFLPMNVVGYHVSIESLDNNSEQVVKSEFEKQFKRFGSSPPFEIQDGKLTLPWFIVFFAGRHIVRFYAVDKNWFDLIRSVPQIYGDEGPIVAGGLAGDNFGRPLFHVENGIGLFGSASMDSIGFVVLPRN